MAGQNQDKFERRKGTRIKVVLGVHGGSHGWLDLLKGATGKHHYCILKKKGKAEEVRRVAQQFIRPLDAADLKLPKTIEQACLQQQNAIDLLIERLVLELAKCQLEPETHSSEIGKIFKNKWKLATDALDKMSDPPTRRVRWTGAVVDE